MSATVIDFTTSQRTLLERLNRLARTEFAARAARYDKEAIFPEENFADLFNSGFHSATVPIQFGGLGLGPLGEDALTLWMMTKEIAKADLSTGRCWEGHVNSMVILTAAASEEQQQRWFPGVVDRGEIWMAWSGEPQAPTPGQKARFGTRVREVDEGFIVDGTKAFCTGATGAHKAILLVNTAGPGGARHAGSSRDTVIMLACDLADPSISIDSSWWDPIGMRATVSHLVRFDQTLIPKKNLIGYPGQYLKEGWQTCFVPNYAASFLGAAEAAFDYALESVRTQDRSGDPDVQRHVAKMSNNIETSLLWLSRVARLWESKQIEKARMAGSRTRYLTEILAEDTVKRAIRVCGARCLNRPSPLERIYRDLSFYVKHDNSDQILATIGKTVLGEPHDQSFYKP